MRPFLLTCLIVLTLPASVMAQHREPDREIVIWGERGAPGSELIANVLTEQIVERSPEPEVIRDRFAAGITQPRLLVFQPDHPTGTAMVLFPGGAYQRVVLDKEGFETAERLNDAGITVFILLYRLPGEGHAGGADIPLRDAQRAIRLVRSRAQDFSLDPQRIGVIGFSAGGHLAGSLATRFDAPVYQSRDAIDAHSARPDFAALIYPVTLMQGNAVHALSRRLLLGHDAPTAQEAASFDIARAVRPDQPPFFLLHALDDTAVPPENSLAVFAACRALDLPVEMHLFAQGGHGFGLRHARGLPVEVWPDLMLAWMGSLEPRSGSRLGVGNGGE